MLIVTYARLGVPDYYNNFPWEDDVCREIIYRVLKTSYFKLDLFVYKVRNKHITRPLLELKTCPWFCPVSP